ncbi:uncharacterized protein PITG_18895 [Phytophthora infestans T30-4]|uniref:Vps53 N-terminal domain-containing protein n=1 Tax=Phytophthora infestans (strain T30-4) TaxID=403677 RepID=D0NZP7_PHYIT|nr:uncharacterized protein PITG_18895 [Phytophthora infestans T30-4]EEY69612.1 conserved hypothetical protein [Phytophthora infestans T30-4]|eukprot:XP_002997173.1 conserved hypothetical protein [Phytophthora infestans T30-4]
MDRLLRRGPGPASTATAMDVLPSEDLLDRPEFDAREFINRNFPDEQSLGDIGARRLAVSGVTRPEFSGASGASGSEGSENGESAAFHKIHDIRGKAEQSEVMVQEICRDIKQLDYAKRHLQTTLTALKRLHMLEELGGQIFADFRSNGPIESLEDNFHPKKNDKLSLPSSRLHEMDVTLLLKSLQRTLMFERDAAQRFEGMADEEELQKVELDENGDAIDPHSAEGIKRKHRRKKREAERKALEEEMEKNGELTDDNNQGLPTIRE